MWCRKIPPLGQKVSHGVRRWFDHGTMKKACQWVVHGRGTPDPLNALFQALPPAPGPPAKTRAFSTVVSKELAAVADAFVDLQEQRHIADYDLAAPTFTRQGALVHVQRAEQAFADWDVAWRNDPLAPLFLLLLLGGEKLAKTR